MGTLVERHNGHHKGTQVDQAYFKRNDDLIKYGFWVIIAVILLSTLFIRLLLPYALFHRQGTHDSTVYSALDAGNSETVRPKAHVLVSFSRRMNCLYRRLTNRQFSSDGHWRHVFELPSSGGCIFLLCYFALISAGLCTKVLFESPVEGYGIQWEVVGFRAAWIGTMQLPLLYATGCKHNLISLITGLSALRLNWLHRWVARTTFMALGVHWAFFYQEWVLANFVQEMLTTRPMVIWGFAAWAAMGLMVVSGFRWFRNVGYEIWVVSHVVLAWAVLFMSYSHSHCTKYFVFASFGVLLYDLTIRTGLAAYRNIIFRRPLSVMSLGLGHRAFGQVLDDNYLRVTIRTTGSTRYGGKYIYLTIPTMGVFQSHPFTVASTFDGINDGQRELTVIVKKHCGFTKQLHLWAAESPSTSKLCFLRGPYGSLPSVRNKDILVLISTGNRTSYCTSLLQEISSKSHVPSKVIVHVIAQHARVMDWYRHVLVTCRNVLADRGVALESHLHVTSRIAGCTVLHDSGVNSLTDLEKTDKRIEMEESDALLEETFGNSDNDSIMTEKVSFDDLYENPSSPRSDAQLENGVSTFLELKDPANSDSESEFADIDRLDCNTSYGRPDIQQILHDSIGEQGTTKRIMVVAAVPSSLAAKIATEVCQLIRQRSSNESGWLDLWIEKNA